MTTSIFQIKYSLVTGIPTSLLQGELAYSQLSGKLYIGNDLGVPVEIGGADALSKINSTQSLLDALTDRVDQHDLDISTIQSTLTTLTGQIAQEIVDRTDADTALSGLISAETTRAQSEEARIEAKADDALAAAQAASSSNTNLQSQIDAEIAARIADVDAEEARALGEEARIEGLIAAETSARIADVDAEEARALGAEAAIQGAIVAEASRAQGAETVLQTNIDTEVTRAQGEEARIEGRIAAEETARADADTILDGKITQEISDRQAAVSVVEGRVTALEGDVSDINTDISDLQAKDTQHDQDIATINAQLSNGSTAITVLTGRVTALEGVTTDHDGRIDAIEAMLNDGDPTFGDVTITGNLVVQGTTVQVDSEVTTIKDPVITLGSDTTTVQDGKNRGIEFKWYDDVSATVKTGFFGFDPVTGHFTFIKDATNTNDAFTGVASDASFGKVNASTVETVDGVIKAKGANGKSVSVEHNKITMNDPDAEIVGSGSSKLVGFVINGGTF